MGRAILRSTTREGLRAQVADLVVTCFAVAGALMGLWLAFGDPPVEPSQGQLGHEFLHGVLEPLAAWFLGGFVGGACVGLALCYAVGLEGSFRGSYRRLRAVSADAPETSIHEGPPSHARVSHTGAHLSPPAARGI